MRQQQRGEPAEGRDSESFAARDQDIFAKLDGAARDSDHHERVDHPLIRAAQLVTVDDGDGEDELDLLLERV